ncbi:hypothetical protein ACKWTF_001630 [Chironomus riparius]
MASSSLLFNCKIKNFYPPIDDGCEGKEDILGTKKFEMMLGDKKIKWVFINEITYKGIKLYFKRENSKFNDFNVRITCMIPQLNKDNCDEQRVKTEAPMYVEHVTGSASSFSYCYRESLRMKFENFARYDGTEGDIHLDMYIKMELMEGNFPNEPKTQMNDQLLRSNFSDLFCSGDFSDFTIICSDQREFRVHRNILSVNSAVLKALMLTNMKESIDKKLQVPDIDGTAMNKILLFMYTQKIDGISDHLQDIIYGAEKYQIENLKALCIAHMIDTLSVVNAVEYFMLASLYDLERLKQLSLIYIQIHYDNLHNTEKWTQLNVEQLELIEKAVKAYKAFKLNFNFEMNEFFWDYES